MKKVAIIGTAGLPPKYGGFETLAANLVKSEGFEFVVYCARAEKDHKIRYFNKARLIYLPFKANGVQSIIYDIASIFHAWFTADTLLILGTSGCVILPFKFLFRSKKVIVNFGGLEWKRDKWGALASWFLHVSEGMGVRLSDAVISDNQAFVNYILKKYQIAANLIEYGGDHARTVTINEELTARFPFLNKPYYVSVSRAQEDNNLHLLLEVFAGFPEKTLVLVSNWEVSDYGIALKEKYSNHPNLFLEGPIYNQQELDAIRGNGRVYIHSHKYCGTAPSLVEAMNLGKPIISYHNDTNTFSTEHKALYFQDATELFEIISGIEKVDLDKLGMDMLEIAKRRYTWDVISKKYTDLF